MHRSRIVRLASLGVLVIGLGLAGVPAAEAGFGFDPALCLGDAAGHVEYTPGVTTTPTANTFTMTVGCRAYGHGHNMGDYALTLTGSTMADTCAGGQNVTGLGTISGSGPEGVIGGSFSFTKSGTAYQITGDYTSGGRAHVLHADLTLVNQSPQPCFYNEADVIGQLWVVDTNPPTLPQHAFAVEGDGNISPGLTLVPTYQSVTFTGTMSGDFQGESGTCTLYFSGGGAPMSTSGFMAHQGVGEATCSGTTLLGSGIAISCDVEWWQMGTTITAAGSCTGSESGPLVGDFTFQPTNANPVTAYTLEGTVGIG